MTERRRGPWAARWWPGHLLVLVLLAGATWLGSWQLGTWEGKRESAARDLAGGEPIALVEALGPDEPFPGDQVGRRVTTEGEWVTDATVFVERDAGYWVVTPLLTGPGLAVPVVRGTSDRPVAPPVEGRARLTGWLQPPEGSGVADDDPGDDVLPQLRVADLVQRVDQDLYGGYLVATEPTAELRAASLEQLPEVGRLTGLRNFFYALEWWAFGGFAVLLWVRFLLDQRPVRPAATPVDHEGRPAPSGGTPGQ